VKEEGADAQLHHHHSFLPEFLENVNKFDMGRKYTGDRIWDLQVPPWAKGDPRRFVDLHRAVHPPREAPNLRLVAY
jgi:hypothetical protein